MLINALLSTLLATLLSSGFLAPSRSSGPDPFPSAPCSALTTFFFFYSYFFFFI